ncbi:MAG: cytochrome oxidase small assembly protein [Oxalicibacterium faecigallinarum]|nr:cytochrome oxidase small assembly protein [Oxalicibacterium faecigallinarum]MDQ7970109.1 cytochrome oxidase small assembly protein [Oxalicibacterium faecigallinarum]
MVTSDQKKRNVRTALILASIAAMFMFGVFAKRMWFM